MARGSFENIQLSAALNSCGITVYQSFVFEQSAKLLVGFSSFNYLRGISLKIHFENGFTICI